MSARRKNNTVTYIFTKRRNAQVKTRRIKVPYSPIEGGRAWPNLKRKEKNFLYARIENNIVIVPHENIFFTKAITAVIPHF